MGASYDLNFLKKKKRFKKKIKLIPEGDFFFCPKEKLSELEIARGKMIQNWFMRLTGQLILSRTVIANLFSTEC